ncbi:MAG: hypothetical protein PWP23_2816 [Candidatus Sumerlaeota bacterium]|nr:hypothetical protein [Candidatus Sumerlaeota bacterium]
MRLFANMSDTPLVAASPFASFCRRHGALALLLLLGFALRVAYWIHVDPYPISDFWEHQFFAQRLLDSGTLGAVGPSAYRLPGYIVFLAGLMLVSTSVAWLSFANVVLSSALVGMVYALARSLEVPRGGALVAAALTAFNPTFIFYAGVLASEHLYILLVFGAFVAAMKADPQQAGFRRVLPPLLLGGSLLGLAILTRGEGVFLAPVLVLGLLAAWWPGRTAERKRLALLALVPLVTAMLVVLPWYVRNQVLVGPGSSLSTTGGLNFYFAHNDVRYGFHGLAGTPFEELGVVSMQQTVMEGGDELAIHRLGNRLGWQHIRNAPAAELLADVRRGTRDLFWTHGKYAVDWSTKGPREAPGLPYPDKEIRGKESFIRLTGWWFLLGPAAAASLLLVWRYPLRQSVVLYGIIAATWAGYAVIFWAKARYRFTAEAAAPILVGMLLVESCRMAVGLTANFFSRAKSNGKSGNTVP